MTQDELESAGEMFCVTKRRFDNEGNVTVKEKVAQIICLGTGRGYFDNLPNDIEIEIGNNYFTFDLKEFLRAVKNHRKKYSPTLLEKLKDLIYGHE
jgi:hypothetical protein